MDKISVIITCYNKEKYISQTIESVLSQTYSNLELIIIDDGSTDNSRNTILKYNDNRIKFISQKNSGETSARNTGIKLATGNMLAFLDGDDVWLPAKLELQCAFMGANHLDMCFCDYQTIDESGKNNSIFETVSFSNFSYLKLRRKILTGNFILGSASSVMVKKTIISSVGLFDEKIKWGGDWEYWMRIIFNTKYIGFLQKELVLIRFGITQVQSTLNSEKRLQDVLFILNKALISYDLTRNERISVHVTAFKTMYAYQSSFKELFKAYLLVLKVGFVAAFSPDLIWLLLKYPMRKLKNAI